MICFIFPVDAKFEITAFHKGSVMASLCENNIPQMGYDPTIRVMQDCFDMHPLRTEAGNIW